MSATTMYAGIAERLATVSELQFVTLGEPTSINALPAAYTVLAAFTRTQTGQQVAMRYLFTVRLVLRWVNQPQAEAELLTLVNAVGAAFTQDPTLGARISQGGAYLTDAVTGFARIAGADYRIADITIDVLEKGAVPFPPSDYTGEI
jgi:hypothetical protein